MWKMYLFRAVMSLRFFRHYATLLYVISFIFAGYIIALCTITKKQLNVTMDCSFSGYHNLIVPVVKIHGVQEGDRKLALVEKVFTSMGYKVENRSDITWEVMWSHTYPFHELARSLSSLKPHQKVNHFPGSGYITLKSNLAMLELSHIPKSFVLPQEKEKFINFAQENSEKYWVLKSGNHRGIQLIDQNAALNANDSFVQEFIKDPFLISKRKFDIGIYVILTSIDPLRVYLYNGDILLRFCENEYGIFNGNDLKSYVVGDDYLPIWKVPELIRYYSVLNYTAKETFEAYLQSKGKSAKKMWSQIYQTIHDVYFLAEENFIKTTLRFGSLRNFFELVRFDFILDKDLNVYLLEVNMSPNLTPEHFPPNRLLYEQVLFSSLNIVGLTRKFPSSYMYRGEFEVSQKDIHVFSEQCASSLCHSSCKSMKCLLCNHCMSNELKQIAISAYLEHTNRGKYRRVVPLPVVTTKNNLPDFIRPSNPSEMNAFMDKWFKGKCFQDATWCQ